MYQHLSFIEKLEKQVNEVTPLIDEMLDNSSIYLQNYNDNVLRIRIPGRSPYKWLKKDEKNQILAKSRYYKFYNNLELLFRHASPNTLNKLKESHRDILNLIEQNEAPSSIKMGKLFFRDQITVYKEFLKLFYSESKKNVILPDTNAIIQFPDPKKYGEISSAINFDFVILPTILSELDRHKVNHRNNEFKDKVNSVIKRLKGYRKQGNVLEGVVVDKFINVKMIATEPSFEKTLSWLDPNSNDDRIIASALELQISYPSDYVILVTADINLQNKAQMANLTVFDTDDLNGG